MNLRDKAYFKDRAAREMAEDLPAVVGSVAELLAHTCRILAAEGHESGLAGQITARGDKKTILLANHGLLTTGAYVEEAAYLAVFFERAARMELRALAAGGIKEPRPELLRESGEFLLQPSIVKGTFAFWSRKSDLISRDGAPILAPFPISTKG